MFGSVLHGKDTEQSDLDILIDAAPRFTLFDMARIALEIEELTHAKVDVRTPDDLPPKFRPRVIAEAIPIRVPANQAEYLTISIKSLRPSHEFKNTRKG